MIVPAASRTATMALPWRIVAFGTSNEMFCLSAVRETFCTSPSASCQTRQASAGVQPGLL